MKPRRNPPEPFPNGLLSGFPPPRRKPSSLPPLWRRYRSPKRRRAVLPASRQPSRRGRLRRLQERQQSIVQRVARRIPFVRLWREVHRQVLLRRHPRRRHLSRRRPLHRCRPRPPQLPDVRFRRHRVPCHPCGRVRYCRDPGSRCLRVRASRSVHRRPSCRGQELLRAARSQPGPPDLLLRLVLPPRELPRHRRLARLGRPLPGRWPDSRPRVPWCRRVPTC